MFLEGDKVKEELEIKVENNVRDDNSTDDDEGKLFIKDEAPEIKHEPSSQYEDENNISATSSCDYNLSQFKKDESQFDASEEEDQDEQSQDEIKQEPKEEPQEEEEESEDDDVPLVSSEICY